MRFSLALIFGAVSAVAADMVTDVEAKFGQMVEGAGIKTEEDVHNRITAMLVEEDVMNANIEKQDLMSKKQILLNKLEDIDYSIAQLETDEEKAAAEKAAAEKAKVAADAELLKVKTAYETAIKFTPATEEAYAKLSAADKLIEDGKRTVAAAAVKAGEDAGLGAKPASKTWLWVVIILVVVGLGAGAFFFMSKKNSDAEGGEADAYTKFLDEELH
jgi:hypothetical protein